MSATKSTEISLRDLAGHEPLRRLPNNHESIYLADHRTVEVIFVDDGYEATRGRSPDDLYRDSKSFD